MKTKLHHQSIPAYLDVYNSLYTDIITGIYPPGEHLPGETTLAETYGVSRNTLRQALAILNEDGMIIKSQGKGTVVAPQTPQKSDEKIPNPMLALSRHTVTDTVLSYNYGAPTDIARDKLLLSSSDIVLACNCVFKSQEMVLGYSFTQVPMLFFNKLDLATSDSDSIKEVILDRLFQYSDHIDMTFKLIYANDMEIEFLNVPLMTPLILTEAMHYTSNNEPFARNKFYFLPEHYHLEFSFKTY
ncbi:MAG: GntR family transcriptional regulator [[Ruminococcus] gnavus]|nr:GntR family transcriptional regulator [Mediterraneibacter gnavus]